MSTWSNKTKSSSTWSNFSKATTTWTYPVDFAPITWATETQTWAEENRTWAQLLSQPEWYYKTKN